MAVASATSGIGHGAANPLPSPSFSDVGTDSLVSMPNGSARTSLASDTHEPKPVATAIPADATSSALERDQNAEPVIVMGAGHFGGDPVTVTHVQPDVIVEVSADPALQAGRRRHPLRYVRIRRD